MCRVLLLSTYDLGRQPFGLASPAAWLRRAGIEVACLDLSRDRLDAAAVREAALVAIHLPMHTATRLALPVIERVRAINPAVCLCAFGLYAPLNARLLRRRGVEVILGPEFEADLVAVALRIADRSKREPEPGTLNREPEPGTANREPVEPGPLPLLAFIPPDRSGLPRLERYASLRMDGRELVAGYTEASRGCKHWCRHCPIVPVYRGRFRAIPVDIVLADIASQVAAGARHITFGDPDFFNGIGHARKVVRSFAERFPGTTYDVTIKIEHLLRHRTDLPLLRETGCLFVTSAVESVDDRVLALLDKGHTRADFSTAVELCWEAGVTLVPTFVPFTPWTTLEGYADLLATIDALDLVEQVAPIQLAIRLLVTPGSRLLELPDLQPHLREFDPEALAYRWAHPDPRVDRLQRDVAALVGRLVEAPRREVFDAIARLAGAACPRRARRNAATIPYLTEPWYC